MDRIPPQARSKHLRACLLCSIIQVPTEFRKSGCPNCEEILQVRIGSIYSHSIPLIQSRRWKVHRTVSHHVQPLNSMALSLWSTQTTAGLRGGNVQVRLPFLFVHLLSPDVQISAKYVRGIYAVRVTGRIPEDVELELERRNIKYRPRDQTDQD